MFDICSGVGESAGSTIREVQGKQAGLGQAKSRQVRAAATIEMGDALLRERRRIARELHDAIGHRLVVIMMTARRLGASRAGQDHARAIDETARDAMAELRGVIGVLRRADQRPLEAAGLIGSSTDDAVAEIVQLYARVAPETGGLHFENAEKERLLSAGVRHTTIRVVQEGLTNALKYGTGAVDVTVSFGDRVRITLVNEVGRPADGESGRADGGLQGLRERVAEHGGSFGFGRMSDRRFFIEATMPSGHPDDLTLQGETPCQTSRS